MTQSGKAIQANSPQSRVYSLDPQRLTQEQIAVAFAMTSRNPEPFDQIAARVSAHSAAAFHERWVIGYGHASVAEHAVLHLAIENYSRLAVDALEDNRLASFTERSSRYQRLEDYRLPPELQDHPEAAERFHQAAGQLISTYHHLTRELRRHLENHQPPPLNESRQAQQQRQCRPGTAPCRYQHQRRPHRQRQNPRERHRQAPLLPTPGATPTGRRDQKRSLAHLPTLVKYAEPRPMLQHLQRASRLHPTTEAFQTGPPSQPADLPATTHAKLLHYDQAAPTRVATAFLFHRGNRSYDQARQQAQQLTGEQRRHLLSNQLQLMERHAPTPREFEQVYYTFELTMDYGALREFRRHRLQSLLPQPPTISLGANIPDLIQQADLVEPYRQALDQAERTHRELARFSPVAAQYLVTHTHLQRMITTFNLREAYHLFKLRNSPAAHPSVCEPLRQAQQLLTQAHPDLFEYLPELQQ